MVSLAYHTSLVVVFAASKCPSLILTNIPNSMFESMLFQRGLHTGLFLVLLFYF